MEGADWGGGAGTLKLFSGWPCSRLPMVPDPAPSWADIPVLQHINNQTKCLSKSKCLKSKSLYCGTYRVPAECQWYQGGGVEGQELLLQLVVGLSLYHSPPAVNKGSLVTELKIKQTDAVKLNACTMVFTVVMLATRYITSQYDSPLESITMQETEQNDVTAILSILYPWQGTSHDD